MKPFYPVHLASGLKLVYEDRDIIVVDKPAGLLSIAAADMREKTAYMILAGYYRKRGGGGARPAIVHRLDRDTSGLMIFARNARVKKKLMDNWDSMVTQRRYICLAEGEMTGKEGEIDLPLGEDQNGRMAIKDGGLKAVTKWKLLEIRSGYSLLSLELITGRRNQIRVHLAATGHPAAGDSKYGARTNPHKRLCLHADRICFRHPADNRMMEFESPLRF